MNISELKQVLLEQNVAHGTYSLEGGLPSEKLCISFDNGLWSVYYSEKGIKTGLRTFTSESAACLFFYRMLTDNTFIG